MDLTQIKRDASGLMGEMVDELRALVAHQSIAFEGYPSEPVEAAGAAVADLMARSGFVGVRMLDLGEGYPVVYADMPGPPGSPTILLYAHYDVQPAPIKAGWESDPWTLTERGGRLYGRGAADDKSGIIIHAATMRLFHGSPPIGIKLVIEGEEEAASRLEEFVATDPDLFRADVFVSADNGNLVAGQPVLETTLRGDVTCYVETRTLDHPVHSGLFGGAAPDALVALIRVLEGLWDENGRTIVPGLQRFDWPGADMPEDLFRDMASLPPGAVLAGSGSLSTRLWSQPSATVIGLDATSVAEAANVLIPFARAKIGMRIAPSADAGRELDILVDFLCSRAPAWATVEVTPAKATNGFVVPRGGRAAEAARAVLRDVYGTEPFEIGGGGGIPLLRSLQDASPQAEFVLWGAEDLMANAHGPNESVNPLEIERMIVSQALLLDRLGDGAPRVPQGARPRMTRFGCSPADSSPSSHSSAHRRRGKTHDQDRCHQCLCRRSGQGPDVLHRRLGFHQEAGNSAGRGQVVDGRLAGEPDGVELLLEPISNPIARTYQQALFEAGIPATTFAIDDIQKEYERLTALGVVFSMEPTPMGQVINAVIDDTCGNFIGLHQVA